MTMTTTIYNFIHQIMKAIKEGFKNFAIYKSQSRYYLSIGKWSIPLLTEEEFKIAMFILCLVIGGIVEGGSIIAQEKEIIREAVKWYSKY